jgi:hypothetical protein
MRTTPQRFFQFKVPTHAPLFDLPQFRWETFVGEFLAPLARDPATEGFVFLNHQPKNYELRFASKDFERIEEEMGKRQLTLGIETLAKPAEGDTSNVGTAFGGGRYLAPDRMGEHEASERRSELVFDLLHAGCALYLDNLVKEGARWRAETNIGEGQNPLGNTFESMLHLISNFSGAKFDVFIMQNDPKTLKLATAWMIGRIPDPRPPSGVCFL